MILQQPVAFHAAVTGALEGNICRTSSDIYDNWNGERVINKVRMDEKRLLYMWKCRRCLIVYGEFSANTALSSK